MVKLNTQLERPTKCTSAAHLNILRSIVLAQQAFLKDKAWHHGSVKWPLVARK